MKSEKSRRQSSDGKKRNSDTSKQAPKGRRTSNDEGSVWRVGSSDSTDGDNQPRRRSADKSADKPQRSTRSTEKARSASPKKRFASSDEERPKRVSRSSDSDSRPRRSSTDRSTDRPQRSTRSTERGRGTVAPKKRFESSEEERPKRVSRLSDSDSRPRRSSTDRSTDRPQRSTRSTERGRGTVAPKKRFESSEEERPKRITRSSDSDSRPRRSSADRSTDRPQRSTRSTERGRGTVAPKKRFESSEEEKPRRSESTSRQRPSSRNEGYDTKKRTERRPTRNNEYENDKPKKVVIRNKKSSKSEMRLNKFIANSGVCSRREADEFIEAGVITVNGEVISSLGAKVKASDDVRFNGQRLQGEKKVYVLLNKPKGYVTTLEDPHADKTVMELIEGACSERIYPVGRLDKNTTGVLLFTNDGELTKQLTHPSNEKMKVYHVHLDKNFTRNDLTKLVEGFDLEDGFIQADAADYVDEDKAQVGVEIHSGRNRIVRRMFESLGYKVIKLDRVYFAGLTKKGLKRGDWRILNPKEVNMLKMGAFR